MHDKSNTNSFSSEQQEERVIIFIDILGFSHFIQNMREEDENNLQKAYKILVDNVHQGFLQNGIFRPSFTFFSDTIVISWPTNRLNCRGSLIFAITQAENIQRLFFTTIKLLSRGVIDIGKLYHNHPTLYGTGLIEAYKKEDKKVINPYVVLTCQAVSFFDGEMDLNNVCIGRNLRNNNGQFYIFFLSFLQMETALNDVLEFKKLIELNLSQSNSENIFKKWRWFSKHFNEHVLLWHGCSLIQISRTKQFILKLRDKIWTCKRRLGC
jgi:hypothetical protein